MSHLSKLTVWCISIFFVLTLASAIIAGHMKSADTSVVEESSLVMGAVEAEKPVAEAAAEAVKPAETAVETAAAAEEKPASETQN